MNDDPYVYSKYCEMQIVAADRLLTKYSNLIKWTQNAKILDIGCAEGTVSLEALLPKIPSNFEKLILADISPTLLNFTRKRISDSRIDCLEIDITGVIPITLQETFDHVFSFFCLNHINEEGTTHAMKNIFDLLKPGGRAFMTVIVTSPLYDIYRNMMAKGKVPSDTSSFQKIISLYHDCENPDETLRKFLENAGFEILLCKYEEGTYTYDSWEKFLGFAFSIIPFSKITSEKEKNKFVEDFVMESKQFDLIQIQKDNGTEKVQKTYSVLVTCVSKPNEI